MSRGSYCNNKICRWHMTTSNYIIINKVLCCHFFDPVHKHPEEDQEIKHRENLEITLSDPIQPGENLELTLPNLLQLEKKRLGPDTWKQFQLTIK